MKNFIKSFKYALSGISETFLSGQNFRIMLLCFVCVVVLGCLCNVSAIEWTILLLCSALVLSLEMMNTSIENTIDLIIPQYHQTAGKAKDIAAGAVLAASIFSMIIALIIFLPYLVNMISELKLC